jgi:hypothetical protein
VTAQRRRRFLSPPPPSRGCLNIRVAPLLFLLAASCGRDAQTYVVTIKAMAFDPAELTVHAGDTVVWRNEDFFPHTATSPGTFDSASIDVKKSWADRTFKLHERAEPDHVGIRMGRCEGSLGNRTWVGARRH